MYNFIIKNGTVLGTRAISNSYKFGQNKTQVLAEGIVGRERDGGGGGGRRSKKTKTNLKVRRQDGKLT